MNKVFISFEADNPAELQRLVLNYALERDTPNSLRAGVPLDAEARRAEAEARERIDADDAEDDAERAKGNGVDHHEPEAASEPAPKRARAPRTPRVPAAAPAPAPAPPEPAAPAPPMDLPPLDTLKSVITAAVRLAQKGEGSKTILDLLPGFKDTTGLAFVMNAEDKHRVALYDLVQAAGLPVV